ncbi:Fur family transcriptional regulator [Bacillus sp. Marseille-P3661]|uniref:Fur family transcriptional regulator n=1 Tax=Bacillus sp. Marseille-P3661 TaxID=1936234 RepID=UPI000C85716D|nr:Fur family transcriptional regulator [Bacillus sp. Marseille-P3661]
MDINQANDILKDKGYKHTGKRELILELFNSTKNYLTAKDVFNYLVESYPGVSYDTVYRNLYILNDIGILESTELNGEKQFRFRCDTENHHHHFICSKCGTIKSIHTCPMNDITKELNGYQIDNHKFEIYGRCPDCIN